jgi:hypothetical protein
VAAAAGMLAAACGGGSPHVIGSPSSTGSAAASISPSGTPVSPTVSVAPAVECAIVTFDEVNNILGTDVSQPNVTTPSPAETDCIYDGPNQIVTVDIVSGENATGFAADKQANIAQGQSHGDVAAVGDQAYYVTRQSPDGLTTILFTLKGATVVTVSSQTSLASLETLMARVLSQTT